MNNQKRFNLSIDKLPIEKQQEFKKLSEKLALHILKELKKHDFCPSFVCLGSETFGTISLLSQLKTLDKVKYSLLQHTEQKQ